MALGSSGPSVVSPRSAVHSLRPVHPADTPVLGAGDLTRVVTDLRDASMLPTSTVTLKTVQEEDGEAGSLSIGWPVVFLEDQG